MRLGITQQELALAAGVTRQTIGGIEGGLYSPSAAVALRLAKALGCRVEDLFWLESDLPKVLATPVHPFPADQTARVTIAKVGGQWIAHPLFAEHAFRNEVVPCDGIGSFIAGSGELEVELLDEPASLDRTVVLAGCTPALSLWSRAAERWYPGLRVHWTFASSADALHALARGEVHAAGVHLIDPVTKEHNTPYIRQLTLDRPVVLVNLGVWEEGFLVRPGNPKKLTRGADLAAPNITIINRKKGAGCRLLLDNVLRDDGVEGASVRGYENTASDHFEVAREVSAGRADAGISCASVAAMFGLGFVPLHEVRYDLAVIKDYLDHEPVRQLFATLEHRWVRSQLRVLGGYNTSRTGEMVAEVSFDA